MIDFIELQKTMHPKFGVKAPEQPAMLDTAHLQMRLNFLLEELRELALASGFCLDVRENDVADPDVSFVHDSVINVNPHEILDALVDLQVVLLGTAHLLGFFNGAGLTQIPTTISQDGVPKGKALCNNVHGLSIFEEAFNRVWQANMQKIPCESAKESKRGFKIDLKKPIGWKAADLSDLVNGFILK